MTTIRTITGIGVPVTSIVLSYNEDNYRNWSGLVVNALKSPKKHGFVNGDLAIPASTASKVHA